MSRREPWYGFGRDPRPNYTATCKFCGEDQLAWIRQDVAWLLVDRDDNLHDCRNTDPEDDFDVIE